jgi:outer membrane protein assembly factor BamD (BamD/ComL family)
MVQTFQRVLWALLAVAFLCGQAIQAEAYVEAEKEHGWFSFSRPAKDTPAAQFAYARELLTSGKINKAKRAFNSLTITWPGSAEAPLAQYAYARILDERGKKLDAFAAYETLMTSFAGRFPNYDQVLQRQFEIAQWEMTRKRNRIFFGGFNAPERAIPLFESVIKHGPRSPLAAEAQYLIGEAYEGNFEYQLAVVAYSTTLHRYPFSPFAEKASFARARALNAFSRAYPVNPQASEEAFAAVMAFMRGFPGSGMMDEARALRDDLLARRAGAAFEIADYYDRIADRPEAALASYRDFVQLFPQAPQAGKARQRINELAARVDRPEYPETEMP